MFRCPPLGLVSGGSTVEYGVQRSVSENELGTIGFNVSFFTDRTVQ